MRRGAKRTSALAHGRKIATILEGWVGSRALRESQAPAISSQKVNRMLRDIGGGCGVFVKNCHTQKGFFYM